MRITEAASTYCFVGHKGRQAQVVRVVVAEAGPSAEVTVRIEGAGLITAEPWRGRLDPARAGQPGGPAWAPSEDAGLRAAGRFVPRPPTPEGAIVEVPVLFDAQPGQVVAGRVIASSGADGARVAGAARAEREVELVVREPGWRMIMVPHFHYDPVWWNTQAGYTSGWDELLWALERRETFQHSGLALVEAHLERARLDAAYKFVLAEVDYLKPFWDLYPDRRDELRSLIRDGRLEIVGGTYNEPNTNLTGAETAIRVAVYGMGFQREVMGASPRTAWQLDVFGHDPQFPGIMADCGLESSAWARGPFHQWGPRREAGSNAWMQFPSEFEWVAPNGLGLLTSYMPDHYSAGWELESATTLEGAMWRAYELFCDLAEVAATRVTLLPVGTDYTPPGRFVSGVARAWSARYAWPRFEVGLPKEFFAAVRAELAERGRRPAPQSRDMGPVYTGKEVSFIDTKQAQRLAETWLAEAEHMAALASLVGAAVPRRALDKAWRQLVFGAHHDGITGSSSDQVYLDLLGGWRESYEIARAVEGEARRRFLGEVSTAGEGDAVVVTNSLGHDRSEMTALELPRPRSGRAYEIRDETGQVLASLSEPAANAQVSVRFLAKDVPGTGHRTFRVASRSARARPGWVAAPGNAIANDYLEIEAAPGRGGGLARVRDRAGQFELVPTGEVGNELLVYPEYADHPRFGEGPWHLLPCGPPVRSGAKGASVRRQTSPLGERLVIDGELVYGETGVGAERESVQYRQFVTLWRESRRVELRTELHGWQGRDRLVRLRFPTTLGGATPVSAVGDAVVARSFAFIEADAAVAPWTLDQGAAEWFGLSTTLVVEVAESSAERDAIYHRSPLGVAEVVTAGGDGAAPWARDLVVALLQKGVTATCSEAPRNRYGGLLGDSNLPDFRIAIGGPGHNEFVAELLQKAPPTYRAQLDEQLARGQRARVLVPGERPLAELWRPNADVRGARDLPVLVVAGEGRRGDHAAVADLIADMADGRIGVAQPRSLVPGASDVPQWTAAIFNRGTPGFAVDYGGAMHVSLLRACTGWPSGVWIDPPRRSAPDGSAFELEHWSHVFEHALFFAPGDWRRAGCAKEAQAYNRPLRATRETSHGGKLPAKAWLFRLAKLGGPGEVVLGALKPSGNPLAAGDPSPPARPDGHVDISLRFYEAAGAPVEVEVASLAPVAQAWRANLLEARQEEAAVAAVPAGGGLRGGSCRLPVRPGELCTMCLRLPVLTPGQDEGASTHDVEVAQPTFSRYWLHNRGAAPMGNQALAVHFQSASAVARAGSSVTVVAHVASGAAHATQAGRLELVAPQDWQVDPPGRLFSLAPGAYLSVKVRVDVPDKCRPGRHFAAVRVADGAGQVQEDILTVDVLPPLGKAAVAGGPSSADAGGPGVVRSRDASALPAPFGHPSGQRASELEAVLEAEERQVGAGKSDQLRLHLSNRTAGELRGEVQLLSPVETWPYVGPSAQGFRLGPGQSCTVTARVIGPVSGWLCSWALFKVMYFGRLWYSPAVRLVLGNKPPVAAPGHKGSA